MACQEKEFYIPYPEGEQTRVYINCTDQEREFVVFLAGEEGNLILHNATDEEGNEYWYEGDGVKTPRSRDIGELIVIAEG